jgi:hypothetical protein
MASWQENPFLIFFLMKSAVALLSDSIFGFLRLEVAAGIALALDRDRDFEMAITDFGVPIFTSFARLAIFWMP